MTTPTAAAQLLRQVLGARLEAIQPAPYTPWLCSEQSDATPLDLLDLRDHLMRFHGLHPAAVVRVAVNRRLEAHRWMHHAKIKPERPHMHVPYETLEALNGS